MIEETLVLPGLTQNSKMKICESNIFENKPNSTSKSIRNNSPNSCRSTSKSGRIVTPNSQANLSSYSNAHSSVDKLQEIHSIYLRNENSQGRNSQDSSTHDRKSNSNPSERRRTRSRSRSSKHGSSSSIDMNTYNNHPRSSLESRNSESRNSSSRDENREVIFPGLNSNQSKRSERRKTPELRSSNHSSSQNERTIVETHIVNQPVEKSLSIQSNSSRHLLSSSSSSQLLTSVISDRYVEVGLENLGNTCFMNSALQCLLHIQPLVLYFLFKYRDRHLNKNSPHRGVLAHSFANLIKEMYAASNGSVITPTLFSKTVGRIAPHLLDFQQQDCQEFIRFLLDGMSEDLCRGPKRRPSTEYSTLKKIVESCEGGFDISEESPLEISTSKLNSAEKLRLKALAARESKDDEDSFKNSNQENDDQTDQIDQSLTTSGEVMNPETSYYNLNDALQASSSNKSLNITTTIPFQPNSSINEIESRTTNAEVPSEENINSSHRDSKSTNGFEMANLESNTQATISAISMANTPSSSKSKPSHSILSKTFASFGLIRGAGSSNNNESDSNLTAPSTSNHSSTRSISSGMRTLNLFGSSTSIPPNSTADICFVSPTTHDNDAVNASDDNNEHLQPKKSLIEMAFEASTSSWKTYLKFNDSIITDIFAGQLQSTVECLTCHEKSLSFEPFLEISVPIPRVQEKPASSTWHLRSSVIPTGSGLRSGAAASGDGPSMARCTLQECFDKYTAEEVMDGDNMVTCDRCKTKRKCLKRMNIFRYPRIMIVHIKRFRYNNAFREKLSTDVSFPRSNLDLMPYLSAERLAMMSQGENNAEICIPNSPPLYDLIAVSHHSGSLQGGHYIAHVNTNAIDIKSINKSSSNLGTDLDDNVNSLRHDETSQRWTCFNDSRISQVNSSSVAGPSAYVLFYQLRDE